MKNTPSCCPIVTIAVISTLLVVGCPAGANLISDGSFETPALINVSQSFNAGTNIGAWSVVGTGTNPAVSIVTSAYLQGNVLFSPQDGNQSLNLAGLGNQATNGVLQ